MLVGDIILLEQGDVVPVDGVLIDGRNVSRDEAPTIGESDHINKVPAGTVLHALREGDFNARKLGPFLLSGTKVLDGVGSFLVTAVGPNSSMAGQ